jgi:hypothetical protein
MLKVLCRKCGRHNVRVGQSSAVIKVVVVVDDKTTYDWIIGRDLKKKKLRRTWHSVINVGYDDGVEGEALLTGFEG